MKLEMSGDFAEYQAELQRHLLNRDVRTYDEITRISLSPVILPGDRYDRLAHDCEQVISAIEIILQLYVSEKRVQALFPELERFRSLSLQLPPYRPLAWLARFDLVETVQGEFRMMETNNAMPGLVPLSAPLWDFVDSCPLYAAMRGTNKTRRLPFDNSTFFLERLLALYAEVRRTQERPTIALISSRFMPTNADIGSLQRTGADMGLDIGHLIAQDLPAHEDRVRYNGRPVDLVIHKFRQTIDHDGMVVPCIYANDPREVDVYWRSLQRNDFVYVNSLQSLLVGESKRILHLLRDGAMQSHFAPAQIAAIESICPMTFPLRSSAAKGMPSASQIAEMPDRYVIKRMMGVRGEYVLLGPKTDPGKWRQQVHLAADGPWIAQEYVPQLMSPVLTAEENPAPVSMYTNFCVFLLEGKAVGVVCRSSRDQVINVAREGAIRPVFVIDG
ncbi:hypothetical protein [Bradyrhizobium sp.]